MIDNNFLVWKNKYFLFSLYLNVIRRINEKIKKKIKKYLPVSDVLDRLKT